MTSPNKSGYGSTTVGHLFSSHPEFIPDPYDRLRASKSNEWAEHKRKLGQQAFKLTYRPNTAFTSSRELHEIPDGLPEHRQKKYIPDGRPAFLPSHPPKKGFNRTINKFPEYALDPTSPKQIVEKKKEIPWRYTCTSTSRPTPSVHMHNSLYRPSSTSKL